MSASVTSFVNWHVFVEHLTSRSTLTWHLVFLVYVIVLIDLPVLVAALETSPKFPYGSGFDLKLRPTFRLESIFGKHVPIWTHGSHERPVSLTGFLRCWSQMTEILKLKIWQRLWLKMASGSKVQQFSRECLELLSLLPSKEIELLQFVPKFHQHFKQQLK